jgi:tetratricopeptide (TPR) repeat protein
VGWGLGAWTSGWGYGGGYYNPYYVSAAGVPYDYSQPVVVNNYVNSMEDPALASDPNAPPPAENPAVLDATALFDQGLALFKKSDYQSALNKFDAALTQLPDDPVVHEVRAVTLFALGDYQQSAAALNSFLSSAPGMDWTTMSSLYGNPKDYEAQLRKLEQHCKSKPNDAAALFVLAYQYLVLGAKDQAVDALRGVVENQPKDTTARRMLDALAPASSSPSASQARPTPAPASAAESPPVDLVGNWRAKAGDTTIDLSITDTSQFAWKATENGKPVADLSGRLEADATTLTLESQKQGTMSGSVATLSPDRWRFALAGAPPTDPGLTFERTR